MIERPLGGILNDAVRIGATVHRRAGPWTRAVHALLRFLETRGFEAPRVLGMDGDGREILAYLEGEAHSGSVEPLPTFLSDDIHLVASARLLRRYHDLVTEFEPPADAHWRLVAPGPHELICHNDWSPWNALFRERRLVAMLDWDLAGPGTRLWDLPNAVNHWCELSSDPTPALLLENARRVELYLDAYGLDNRSALWPTLTLRLRFVADFIDAQAGRGDPGMQRLADSGVPRQMREKIQYIEKLRALLAQ